MRSVHGKLDQTPPKPSTRSTNPKKCHLLANRSRLENGSTPNYKKGCRSAVGHLCNNQMVFYCKVAGNPPGYVLCVKKKVSPAREKVF